MGFSGRGPKFLVLWLDHVFICLEVVWCTKLTWPYSYDVVRTSDISNHYICNTSLITPKFTFQKLLTMFSWEDLLKFFGVGYRVLWPDLSSKKNNKLGAPDHFSRDEVCMETRLQGTYSTWHLRVTDCVVQWSQLLLPSLILRLSTQTTQVLKC